MEASEGGVRSSEAGVADWYGCWDLNLGSLEEQYAPSTAEAPCSAPTLSFSPTRKPEHERWSSVGLNTGKGILPWEISNHSEWVDFM